MSVPLFTTTLVVACLCGLGESSRLVDLSHPMREGVPNWPTQLPYSLNVTYNGTTGKGYWYQADAVCAGTHAGTHLDAPCHFSRGSWCVADIPVELLVDRPAVCIHIKDHVGYNGDYQLDTGELHVWEDENGRIPEGAVVLINTGWSRFWEKDSRYRGTSSPSPSLHRFPGVSPNAAQWLADQRHVVGVGIDTLSLDYGQTRAYESHVIMGKRNVYILENLANMDDVPSVGFRIHAFPAPYDKASGAPVRVVAVINGANISIGGVPMTIILIGLVMTLFYGHKALK